MIATSFSPAGRGIVALALLLLLVTPFLAFGQQASPAIPADLPVFLIGDPRIDASRLQPYEATFAMGRVGKDGPLGHGEAISARAYQTIRLERTELDGRAVIARSFAVRRPGSGEDVLANGVIYLDAATLAPLRSQVVQGGSEMPPSTTGARSRSARRCRRVPSRRRPSPRTCRCWRRPFTTSGWRRCRSKRASRPGSP